MTTTDNAHCTPVSFCAMPAAPACRQHHAFSSARRAHVETCGSRISTWGARSRYGFTPRANQCLKDSTGHNGAGSAGHDQCGAQITSAEKSSSTQCTMYVTASVLNVRSGAGTNYKIVGKLSRGTAVDVTGTHPNGWKIIVHQGKQAFVCSDYLTNQPPETKNDNAASGVVASGSNPAVFASNYLFEKTKLYTHDFVKNDPRLPHLSDLSVYGAKYNYGYDCNCANFVTACCQNVGWLSKHYNSVGQMYRDLKSGSDKYREISPEQARPGDIWCSKSLSHTEIVYSRNQNQITLIGSNNEGTDKQRVTYAQKPIHDGVYLSRRTHQEPDREVNDIT